MAYASNSGGLASLLPLRPFYYKAPAMTRRARELGSAYQTSANGRISTRKERAERGWWATWNTSAAMSAGLA